jgi:hypothetical protein
MEEMAQLNVLMDLFAEKMPTRGKTPNDVGNNLFKGLLEKSNQSLVEGEGILSPYQDTGKAFGTLDGGDRAGRDLSSLERLETRFRRLGLPMDQLRLPKTAVPQLMGLLENMGFPREEVNKLILSVSDKEGFVHLDRLMARLQQSKKGAGGKAENGLVIPSKDIPVLGEALFAMGLGVGTIKEVMEKCVNQKGEVALEALSASLRKYFPGANIEGGLSSLLERFNIQSKSKAPDKGTMEPDLKNMVRSFSETASHDGQKKIKEEIARLLGEKGVPPQEAKSFLESLTIGYARTLAKTADTAANTLEKGTSEAESRSLAGQVVIRSKEGLQKGGWQQKIMDILQKEKGFIVEGLEKNWFQEGGQVRLAMADAAKQVEPRVKPMPFDTTGSPETRQRPAIDPSQTTKSEVKKVTESDLKPIFSPKAELAGDPGMLRINRDQAETGSVVSARNAIALPEPLPKIFDKMVWMINAGEQRGRVHISPPELGRLDLDLVVKQGHLQAQLSAENSGVKEIIEANLGQLKQQLTDMGFVVDRFDVMVGLGEKPFSRDQTWTATNRKGQSSRRSSAEGEELAVSAEGLRTPRGRFYQIDVHV